MHSSDDRLTRMAEALTSRRTSRRDVLAGAGKLAAGGVVAAVVVGRTGGWAAAQATPAASSSLDELGLPQLTITATDTGFEGAPPETAAGRYLVTIINKSQGDAAVDFMLLPEGVTIQDLSPTAPGAEATPGAGMEMATPGASPEAGEPAAPPWFYTAYIAGGAGAAAGQTAQAVIDLKPGNYAIWGDDPSATQKAVALTVTGSSASPSAAATPQAAVTINEVSTANGFAFQFEGSLMPGSQVVAAVNHSDQPHFIVVIKSPGPITMDQLMTIMSLPENGTPPPGVPNPADFVTAAYASSQSAGTTTWHAWNFEAGTYILACFVPDERNGMPHAAEGMINIVTIGGAATPAP